MKTIKVVTETGSQYFFRVLKTKIYVSMDNVENMLSRKVKGEWEVEVTPWPPKKDENLKIVSAYWQKFDHPKRMPGGGKVTSLVTSIEELTDV